MKKTDEQNERAAEVTGNRESVKILRLRQMIFLGKGSFARQSIHAFISVALRLFFRRIEASGVEKVPPAGAIIFVLNHPNGLVDPALVFVSLPRRVSFLAKSTLFSVPGGGFLLRTLETLPVYRRIDAPAEMSKNLRTFKACRELLNRGRCIAIFPEGVSHNETKLQPLKTGAARIALGALGIKPESVQQSAVSGQQKTDDRSPETEDRINLKIMAVGLYYTSKTAFRSEALIRYGEIFDVEAAAGEMDEEGEPPRQAVQDLTDKIEAALRRVTLNLESEKELDTILRAEALFSSVYKNLLFKQTLAESFRHLQNLAEKYQLLGENEPEKMRELDKKIARYESDLKTSGVTAESLSVLQHPTAYVLRYLVLRVLFLILLSPPALVGAIIHSPAFVFSNFIGLMFRTHGADAAGSTYKILAACLFMPLTWLIAAAIIFWFFGWQIALFSIPLMILCGYVALRSSETLIDMTVWLKSAWLLFRQKGLFLRLLLKRETLRQEIGELIEKD
ncbi:MAG TPA: lysophospholipid acyltransferase family protein [Pyrinomonadaceae bacterium]|nr:lysophospholipid acyltransferase family protein [Pyrinomonadaceae bacterium]